MNGISLDSNRGSISDLFLFILASDLSKIHPYETIGNSGGYIGPYRDRGEIDLELETLQNALAVQNIGQGLINPHS